MNIAVLCELLNVINTLEVAQVNIFKPVDEWFII